MNPNAVIMSGPHQGRALDIPDFGNFDFTLPHPTLPGIICRYSRNDSDGPITGAPGAVQLHYLGDAPAQARA